MMVRPGAACEPDASSTTAAPRVFPAARPMDAGGPLRGVVGAVVGGGVVEADAGATVIVVRIASCSPWASVTSRPTSCLPALNDVVAVGPVASPYVPSPSRSHSLVATSPVDVAVSVTMSPSAGALGATVYDALGG